MSPQEFQRRNGPSPLAIPGQAQINFQHLNGPLAQPVAVTMQGPGGSNTIVYGGLTSRVQLAAMVIGCCAMRETAEGKLRPPTPAEAAAEALDIAEQLLREDNRRMQADMETARKAAEEAEQAAATRDNRTPGGIALP